VTKPADRRELIERVRALRNQVREEVGVAALIIEPSRACDRLVARLLDSLNGLEALLQVRHD
jgi:DNA-binding response OmpR family regulator